VGCDEPLLYTEWVTQHIESGASVGEIVMLRKAVEYVEGKLREAGWRGLRLLDS
jgi:hypothetical protein